MGLDTFDTQSGAMASNNNPIARPGMPMSYSQSSMGSGNTLNFSHSQMGSFNASQSVASTPRATPPPPKGSQQSTMSFSYPNGMPAGSRSSYGGFDEPSGYGPVMSVHEGFKPQIYRVRKLPKAHDLRSNASLLISLVLGFIGCLFQRSCVRDGSQWNCGDETP